MSYPKFPSKYGRPASFGAADLVQHDSRLTPGQAPERVVICFQRRLFDYLVKKGRGKALPVPFGELSVLRATPKPIGVIGNFGIGAPAAVFTLEWLAALGGRQFIAAGFAGGLLESQTAGDLVLCTQALRDEGTSYHYLPAADFSEPTEELKDRLARAFSILGYAHERGPSWTTDAPLRETQAEIETHRAQGILTVEMEAAALFAASQALGLACAAAFTIGDNPKNGRWQVDFDRAALQQGLERLGDAALLAFEE